MVCMPRTIQVKTEGKVIRKRDRDTKRIEGPFHRQKEKVFFFFSFRGLGKKSFFPSSVKVPFNKNNNVCKSDGGEGLCRPVDSGCVEKREGMLLTAGRAAAAAGSHNMSVCRTKEIQTLIPQSGTVVEKASGVSPGHVKEITMLSNNIYSQRVQCRKGQLSRPFITE
jgi:hypothetical protein